MMSDEEPTQEELDEDTLAKLAAIKYPDKFTAEPGQMMSAEEMTAQEEEEESSESTNA